MVKKKNKFNLKVVTSTVIWTFFGLILGGLTLVNVIGLNSINNNLSNQIINVGQGFFVSFYTVTTFAGLILLDAIYLLLLLRRIVYGKDRPEDSVNLP